MSNFNSAADYVTEAYGEQHAGPNGAIAGNLPASLNGTFVLKGGKKHRRQSKQSKRRQSKRRQSKRRSRKQQKGGK